MPLPKSTRPATRDRGTTPLTLPADVCPARGIRLPGCWSRLWISMTGSTTAHRSTNHQQWPASRAAGISKTIFSRTAPGTATSSRSTAGCTTARPTISGAHWPSAVSWASRATSTGPLTGPTASARWSTTMPIAMAGTSRPHSATPCTAGTSTSLSQNPCSTTAVRPVPRA